MVRTPQHELAAKGVAQDVRAAGLEARAALGRGEPTRERVGSDVATCVVGDHVLSASLERLQGLLQRAGDRDPARASALGLANDPCAI